MQAAPTRFGVNILGADFFAAFMHGKPLSELTYLNDSVKAMLDDLAWWGKALKAAREAK